ncbi:MAG: hypothetical protein JW893_05175 [Candidatus Omnitrophica bacterium]|nr:hypothetical protein [Candidatus Omnitrophota bacterium]
MSKRLILGWVSFILIAIYAFPSYGDSQTCQICLGEKIEAYRKDLDHLEYDYVFYRWTEAKIRRLLYENMWRARQDMGDPFLREKREKGEAEERRLDLILQSFENDSRKASNGVAQRLAQLKKGAQELSSCDLSKSYGLCIQGAYQGIYDQLAALEEYFNHVFEHEREYRLAVQTTASGRQGLYYQDALEGEDIHDDFYWRFESDRAPGLFEEDRKVMEMIQELHRLLTWDLPGATCCYEKESLV